MFLVLSDTERAALVAAAARERQVRRWRRDQAVLLVADGKRPEEAAASVGCSRASVDSWIAAWRDGGLAGLVAVAHPPSPRAHAAPLETLLTTLLADDPQQHGHHATGWTVPLLHREAREAGIPVSAHTVRRAVRRLGWRWKRPQSVLGRPDPA
jgi:transposase